MVTYSISGSLPAPWEDFFCVDKTHPHITLMTRANAEDCGGEYGDGSDGWLDIIIDVDVICEDIARLAIADALGIDNPEDIVIDQARFAQSV